MIQSPEAGGLSVSDNADSTTVLADICDLNSFGQGEVGVFTVCLLFLSWAQNGDTMCQCPKQSPDKDITVVC